MQVTYDAILFTAIQSLVYIEERFPLMTGMMALEAYSCITLQFPLVYVRIPKALVASEGYHYH
jgi:hypothetical protein